MTTLPFVGSLLLALIIAPKGLAMLDRHGWKRLNYAERELVFPAGAVVVVTALVTLIPLALIQRLGDETVFSTGFGAVLLYSLGVALLGLVDDLVDAEPRGWRGHGAAVLSGGLSSGLLKAVGSLGLALYVFSGWYDGTGEYLLAVGNLVLATNLFNLLDLRPGRSLKVFVVLAAVLTAASGERLPFQATGLFTGALIVAGFYDLRGRAMLGDTGSNLIGGLAGFWLVLTLSTLGQVIALVVLLTVTIYAEFRSISALVDRTSLLRQLDSLGRVNE